MPLYDYKCRICGKKFEVIQKMSDRPVALCPDCGGEGERQISSEIGISFKGTGFYVNDIHSNGSSPASESK